MMRMHKLSAFFMFAALLGLGIIQTPDVQAQAIGQGFFCNGTTILNKRNKTIAVVAAKRTITTKITALGNSKKEKAKKAALKLVKDNLVACSKGTFIPGSGANDVAGTYTGTLTRTSSTGASSLCDYDTSITGSFLVEVDGSTVKVSGSINPFHIPVSGKKKGSAYELNGTNGSAFKKALTLTLKNVSATAGDFTAVRTGQAFSPARRKFVTICKVNFSGSGFVRVK